MDNEPLYRSLLYIEKELMDDNVEVDNSDLSKRLSEICQSLDNELLCSHKMYTSESVLNQQLGHIQSLKDEVFDSHKIHETTLNEQQLDHIRSLEDQVFNSHKMDTNETAFDQQIDRIQSLEDEVFNSHKMPESTVNQQQLDHIQSLEDKVSDSLEMHISALNQQQLDHIQSLEDEGLVNKDFRIAYSLKEECGSSFFLDLFSTFLRDARAVMRNMTYVLESSVVDFDILNVQCHKLKGSAACIGACKLKKACDPFIAGVDKKSKIECLWALKDIKQECRVFRSKTKTFMKLEKEIVEAEKSKS